MAKDVYENIERAVAKGALCCATCRVCKTVKPRNVVKAECAAELWPIRYRTLTATLTEGRDCPAWQS